MSNTYRRKNGHKFWKNNGGCWIWRVGDVTQKEAETYYTRDGTMNDTGRKKGLKNQAHKCFRLQWRAQKIKILRDEEDYLNPVKAEYGDVWDWF